MKPFLLNFPQRGDERGWLVVAEGNKDVPFDIKRIFYIYGTEPRVVRGQHANRNSEFVLVNVAGSCKVRTRDGRGDDRLFELNRPNMGLFIPKMVWKDMFDFSPDSILLCLSSESYDPSEYIRSYELFSAEVTEYEND
ncbi:MAG: FdtA/QdtA family cupin domain-containing protein [Clostridiales bacterium]|nr:FdtA/QdtA family cupin domain-containing protein [Clostridiales bacterium]